MTNQWDCILGDTAVKCLSVENLLDLCVKPVQCVVLINTLIKCQFTRVKMVATMFHESCKQSSIATEY